MAKYIDGKCIQCEALLKDKVFMKGGESSIPYVHGYYDALDDVENAIKNAPAADVVPVVRCGECKHFQQFRPDDGFCKIDGMLHSNDFFCAYGARMDGDGE